MPEETSQWTHAGGRSDDVNGSFHEAYDAAREDAEEAAPVLILLGDALVLRQGNFRREMTVTPRVYHVIRSVAHAPIALFSVLHPVSPGLLDARARHSLGALVAQVGAALSTLEADLEDGPFVSDARDVLVGTRQCLQRTLDAGTYSRAQLAEFADEMGPVLLRLAEHATRFQLATLHAQVETVFATLTAAQRAALQVVVAGAHQARERSLGMQYFRKRFAEPTGSEERVAFAENVADEAAALKLVGTRRFDRAIAQAFFGDVKRLQQDVLGDATAAHLQNMDLVEAVGSGP